MKRLNDIHNVLKIYTPSLRQEIAIEAHYVDLCLYMDQQIIPMIIEHSDKSWFEFNDYLNKLQSEKRYHIPITKISYDLITSIFNDNIPLEDAFGKSSYGGFDYAFSSGVTEFAYKQFIKDAETKPTKEIYEEFINGDNGIKRPKGWMCEGEDIIPAWKRITYEVFEKLYKWSINMLKYRDNRNFM